ncbi:MAG TPA: hypothetical protein GXX38_01920 [Clostridia bacterium]|nr:hypothetical protein [Clostridia bacterium]
MEKQFYSESGKQKAQSSDKDYNDIMFEETGWGKINEIKSEKRRALHS